MSIENELSQIKEKINEIEEKSADGGYIYDSVGNVKPIKNIHITVKCPQVYGVIWIEADHFDIEVVQTDMLTVLKNIQDIFR